ncbi:MAG: hypothetical protein LBP73_03920 [Clostridiales Family XIII bacterium]|jgi:hypothetical protein|nr:hypothetical protein [Clostridiales Family XIII bacterium]
MEYTDTESAKTRRDKEEARFKDIYAGEVRAGNEILHFERVGLYEDLFSVMLPKSYTDMPEALAKLKYPAENRPAVIKTNDDTTVNFAFAYYAQAFSEDRVESAVKAFLSGMRRANPGAKFFETRFLKTEKQVRFGYFDFMTTAFDADMYQLFAFVPVRGSFLHGIFNAPAELMRTWNPVVLQVMRSIEDRDDRFGKTERTVKENG